MSIRAIYGYRRSGKDTLCNIINDGSDVANPYKSLEGDEYLLMYPGKRIAIADNLKKYVSTITGLSVAQINEGKDTMHYNNKLYRQHLVDHSYDKDWLQIVLDDIDISEDYIITDLRYRNDLDKLAEFCRETGMTLSIIHILREDGPPPFEDEGELDDEEFDLVVKW